MNIIPKMSGAALALDPNTALDALLNSDAARKAVSDRQRDVLAFRTNAAKRLADLNASADQAFPRLREAKDAAMAEAKAAEQHWREACQRVQQAQQALTSASFTHDRAMSEVERQLLSTAHPEIALFLNEMDDLREAALKGFAYNVFTERNPVTQKAASRTVNNANSIEARREAIRAAQEAARAMRLEPDQSTVPARLQELRNNLPAIEGL